MYHWLFFLFCFLLDLSLGFEIRPAIDADVSTARKILLQQAMNPLSLSKENLLVAYDEKVLKDPLIGFGQIRPLDDNFSELASLYVVPERRKQGIGGAIVQALLERHATSRDPKRICLLTLKPTTSFYEPYGFKIASETERKQLPKSLQFEFPRQSRRLCQLCPDESRL